ncbi:MAG: nucleoid-associated protein, YbaB/EbfC family [Deltaproteobacteria bacterium RBG_13_65_10]|nr:MAG: nucleoid-associated protein, YbaB/EbfC family [Deltaproteobacteria bacterium RBG_13_65_10]
MQGPLKNIMKQARDMQEKMARVQEDLKSRQVEATAGGGMVAVTANGAQEILTIRIEREIVNPDDVEMLQDLVRAAVNEVLRKSRDLMAEEMGKITGGLGIPGLP